MQQPLLVFLLTAAFVAAAAEAQCAPGWQPGFGPAGTDYEVHATGTFDPDGIGGPLPPRLVVGGRFTIAGGTAAESVASLDPLTGQWQPLGAGLNGPVLALATLNNGDLVAGGQFNASGNQSLPGIALWNGTAWSPLGSGTLGSVLALCVLATGDLIAGGIFNDIGDNVARWNGTAWSAVGAVNGAVLSLLPLTGPTFVAGGLFPNGIQRWTGAAWATVGLGVNGAVAALAQLPSGALVAGGAFTVAGTAPAQRVALWNGAAWAALGAGCDDEVNALLVLGNGDLLAGGAFASAGGVIASCVAQWNGSAWSAAGTTEATGAPTFVPDAVRVNSLSQSPVGVVAGGSFSSVGGVGANNVALLSETNWSAANPGTNAPIVVLTQLPNGDVVAGGGFRVIDGVAANGIARWDGTGWFSFGPGVDDTVRAVAMLPNGELVVGGRFTSAGGAPANNIARWTAGGWLPLGAGTDDGVAALAVLPNGNVVAGGDFLAPAAGLASWNGTSWSAIGGGLTGNGLPGRVVAAVIMPNGDLVVAGDFIAAGGVATANIARWDGAAWSPLGAGLLPWARTMTTLQNGDLLVGGTLLFGSFMQAVTGVARWDGSSWSAFGPLPFAGNLLNAVYAFARLPGGDLAAGGKTASAAPGVLVARWNGTNWSPMAGPTSNSLPLVFDDFLAMAPSRDGPLLVGGLFTRVGGVISAGLARLTTTCPATAFSIATGCPSSGGNNLLDVTALPWTGATCRLRSTGVPTPSLVFAVLGFGQLALPLSALFAQAGPGCVLTAAPDFVDVGSSVAGSFDYAFALPNTPALAGIVLYHQHVPFELDPGLQLLAVTATNTLQLTVGTF